jgi:signal transduction histidine kinase
LHSAFASRFSATEEQFLVQRLARAALIGGLVAGGLGLLLALYLTFRLLQPIRELRYAAQHLSSGDLSQRVPVRGHDELADLASTFNQMAGSLQQSQESRRAMTADIAHELRTPLAVQRASLEALQDGVYPPTSDNLASLLEQNQLLNRLVEDLRTLALADAGQLILEPGPTNPSSILEQLAGRFRAQADAHQVAINLDIASGCPEINADAARLEQILGNLISNALRHTLAGGNILLRLTCSPTHVQYIVQDSGSGIPEESLPFIFERFYRADKSRSRSEGGSGLGLAIARQLAEAHHGTLVASNAPGGGAVFTLALPVK